MDTQSGKFLATAAGIAAGAYLLSQLKAEEEPVIENYINYRIGGRAERVFRDPKTGSFVAIRGNSKLDNLLSGCDDDTFFQPANYQSTPGSATDSGRTVAGGPPETVGARIQMQLASPQQRDKELKDFQQAVTSTDNVYKGNTGLAAAGIAIKEGAATDDGLPVEYFATDGDQRPGSNIAQPARTTIAQPPSGNKTFEWDPTLGNLDPVDMRAHNLPTAQTTPLDCGPQGTIREYSGQRLMASNFEYPAGKKAILQPAMSLTDTLPVGNMSVPGPDGNPMNIQIADRLVYSTLTRARCPGTVDMIRGDLPIPKGGQYSAPAGNAADTLEAGAFAAMFGLEARTAQQTTALILADQAGTRPTLAGADIAELIMQRKLDGNPAAPLQLGSTAITAAQTVLDEEGAASAIRARTGVDSARGATTVFTGLVQ